MTLDLFTDAESGRSEREELRPGAVVLRRFALPDADALLAAVRDVAAAAPFRNMVTPGGARMSVAMTNCGALGWVTDAAGYRYDALDPESGAPWPALPAAFQLLAREAAAEAGFAGFEPDACLVNRYEPGTRLTLHQDKDEQDFRHPIVSVSLGLPAVFQLGGPRRGDRPLRVRLSHGDVVVWGGPARRFFHGVLPLAEGFHPATGARRINLTLRKAG
jgi:alkylated DNA repair protein (DNA oxidative demethylase)